jgi:hypothetical protein
VTAIKPSYFIQVVYRNPLQVTSSSVGRCEPSRANLLPQGMAIISLRNDGCVGGPSGDNPAFRVSGTSDVNVDNGSIYVNSNDPNCALDVGGTGRLNVDGTCAVIGGIDGDLVSSDADRGITCIDGVVHPTEQLWSTNPLRDIDPPNAACSLPGTRVSINTNGTQRISPGHYTRITVLRGTLNFDAGIYCIDQFDSQSRGKIKGNGVVIYMPPNHVGWDATALSSVEMTAPNSDNCAAVGTCDWKGLLLWADITDAQEASTSVVSQIHISGGSDARWTGMIYGPRSQCRVEGQGEGYGINSQLVCWSVDLIGTSQLDIFFEPPEFLMTAPRISLNQ